MKRAAAILAALVALAPAAPVSFAAPAESATPQPAVAKSTAPQPAAAPRTDAGRPRLALVLSGGGARGAAHIGVLRVLEEMHVPVDLVVGTSMGSIVGGLYAVGYTPAEIEDILKSMKWNELFVDHAQRDEKSFRRKQDDWPFMIPTRIRFKGLKPYLPQSFLGGQRLELLLRSLEMEATGETDFNRFPIPYRAVAADLTCGEAVIIDHGSLATAMRASMSVAGMFAPVDVDGKLCVDGGAAANLPVGIAQGLGAVQVIAIDITSPLSGKEDLGSVFSILGQMTSFVTFGNRIQDLNRLRAGDVLIQPNLGDLKFTEFQRADEAVAIGEAAARAAAKELRAYAVDDAAWAAYMAKHHRRPATDLVVDQIHLDNTSWVADQVVTEQLHVPVGKTLDGPALRDNLMRLSALDYFGTIRDEFEHKDGTGTLSITTPQKPYGRNSVQLGISLRDDFQGENFWALALRHQLLAANRRGGEWENLLQIGETSVVHTEFYQPFDYGMKWFVAPGGELRRQFLDIWSDGQAVSELKIGTGDGYVDFGRVLGNWGDIRVGAFTSYENGEFRIGPPDVPEYKVHDDGAHFRFRADTRDSTVFPRHGVYVDARYAQAFEGWGSDSARQYASFTAGVAVTTHRITLVPSIEGVSNIQGVATVDSLAKLGGLLRLSGLGQDELLGDKGGMARLLAYYRLTRFDLGALTSTIYGGISLETGNVYADGEPVSWNSLRHGGSVYVAAQTFLGPIYLGYGLADGGRDRIYLVIGQHF